MITLVRGGGRPPLEALALAVGIWVISGSWPTADGGWFAGAPQGGMGCGTLGYGPPGLYPGFQGFGLGYHLGYGYGGAALGVGAGGGYPFYGGPGYPHPWPRLRRFGSLVPFPYYGGPGAPTPDHPNYFGGVGPLVPDQPVITIEADPNTPGYASYGPFTGTRPYPDWFLAPFTAAAAARGSSSGVSSVYPGTTAPNAAPAPGLGPPSASTALTTGGILLGIDAEPAVDADGVRGMKVSKVYPGTAAERAGLHAGDVIHSINGYLTTQPGNLEWIIANASPDNTLKMSVRTVSDGKEHTISAQFP